MAQEHTVRVIVERRKQAGCGTFLGVLILIGLAIEYWYVALAIVAILVVIGIAVNAQRREKELERQRHRPGPRDPWLNHVAVALADLGLTEIARNTGGHLGGAPMEGDIGLQEARLLVYVNLLANPELARQAEVGLRAQPNIRNAVANGQTTLKTLGPLLLVANGRGGVVDEYRMNEVEHALAEVPLPPALKRPAAPPPASPGVPALDVSGPEPLAGDPLAQIRKLAELRDAGVLTDAEFEAKKAELLRRV